jgi:hypothetical protein
MRGLREAAALLLPILATAFVIPADEITDRVFSNPTLGTNLGTNPSRAERIIEYSKYFHRLQIRGLIVCRTRQWLCQVQSSLPRMLG